MERIQRLYIKKESTSSLDMIGEPLDANDPTNVEAAEKMLDDIDDRMRQSIKSRKEFFATFKGRFEALSENIQINAESFQDYRELLSDIRHEITNLSKIIDSRSNDRFSQEYQNMLEILKSYEIRVIDEISLCEDYPQQTTPTQEVVPSKLDSDDAKKIFNNAIAGGFMQRDGNLYRWIGQINEFAKFVELSSRTLDIRPCNDRIPWRYYKIAFSMSDEDITSARTAKNDYSDNRRSIPDKTDELIEICNL